jgi:hypothetical protein
MGAESSRIKPCATVPMSIGDEVFICVTVPCHMRPPVKLSFREGQPKKHFGGSGRFQCLKK